MTLHCARTDKRPELMTKPKTYRYKNKLLTIKEMMEHPDINLSLGGIYKRIHQSGISENGSVTKLLKPKKQAKPLKKPFGSVKKYRYNNKLLTIRELMAEPDIYIKYKAIYNRIRKAGILDGDSVTSLLKVNDQRIQASSKNKNAHAQRNQLKAIKDQLSFTWNELAMKFEMKPYTFSTYRLPSTSKAYKPFKQHHRDKIARFNEILMQNKK